MLEHLVGPIASVAAQMTDATYGDWSTIALALEFENRAVGTMLGSYDSSYAYPDSQLVEINGTAGRIVIHDTVRELSIQKAGDETASVWRAGYFNDEARDFHGTFDRHVDAVLAALRAGAEPPVHARAGRRALELAHAAIASHETGARVARWSPQASTAPARPRRGRGSARGGRRRAPPPDPPRSRRSAARAGPRRAACGPRRRRRASRCSR